MRPRPLYAAQRAARVAFGLAVSASEPAHTAAVIETASALLPLFTARGWACISAMAYAPRFASAIVPRIYASPARVAANEVFFITIVLFYLAFGVASVE